MMKHSLWVAAVMAALVIPAAAWCEPPDPAARDAARASAFAAADANGDGALSPAEFATFRQLMEQHRADKMFQHLDADGNGTVTLAELQATAGHWRRGGCR
jgi:hypothetical protein